MSSKTKTGNTKISYRTIISNKTLGEFVKDREDKKEIFLQTI